LQVLATGVTVIASSGDDGVANFGCNCNSAKKVSYDNCACQQDSGSVWVSSQPAKFNKSMGFPEWSGVGYFPSFPASCPYVTAVGATQGSSNLVPQLDEGEQACQSQLGGIITSGGGFSTYYKRPAWQDAAVDTYFRRVNGAGSTLKPAPGFNSLGRGYPDISLLGVAYGVYINTIIYSLYGTSASAPAFAAMGKLTFYERYICMHLFS
jgi:subtilase family serine protease